MRSSQKKLVWILLAAVVFLLLVAAASVVLYLLVRQRPDVTSGWRDPIAEVRADQISPDLALYPLAGALELETIDAAITNSDWETAYASIVFSLNLSDAQRIGRLILLGRGFAAAEQPERAALVYGQIADLAILSPNLNDPARAEALVACGSGWADLGQKERALDVYGQVYTIAMDSPYLQRAHRRELLTVLESAYGDLGAADLAEGAQIQIRDLDRGASFQLPATPPELPDLPAGDEPVSSPEVGALEEARRQAAFDLLQTLEPGLEPLPDRVASLDAALQAEDAAKLALYRQELEATTQPSRRINVHWHLIRWLVFKYQVAQKGLGLSIVPAWEGQLTEIQSALSTAYEDLFFDYEDLITGQPDVALMEPGRYEIRRAVTLAGRLGLYPNYPEQRMADKVRETVNNLIAAGFVEPLYVDMTNEEGGLRFFLSPAGTYGMPAQEP